MLLQPSIRDKGLTLLVDYDLFLPTLFVGDPGRIRQILTNLVGNAVKFTSQGHVLIRLTGVPDPDTANCVIHVAIEDSGIGITPEKLGHIFGEFNQVEEQRNRQFEGTGLGLAITKRLIELMGGSVWVESEPGKGSCFGFRITLPMSENAQPQTPNLPGEVRHVMVVDDLAVNRAILEKQLAQLGVRVTSCNSGHEALERMDDTVDMVLSDHNMPDIDGLELVEELHARGWEQTTFVLLSSNPSAAQADPASRLLQGILQKPIPRAELFARLSDLGARTPQPHGAEGQPVHSIVAEDAPDRPRAPAQGRRMRVLAAEDNKTNQLVLRKMLQHLQIELQFAHNGLEAVSAYREFEPDLIFMDISMPKMDGKEATGQIREIEQATGRHVPIVALTAHAMSGDADGILAAGLDYYLTKPLRKELILERIEASCPQGVAPPQAAQDEKRSQVS